jgi:small subunit ribosomal protein S1
MTQSVALRQNEKDRQLDHRAVQERALPLKGPTPLRQQLQELIQDEYDYTRPRRGQVREATVLQVGENDIVVDLEAKRDGIVPPQDLGLLDPEYRASLRAGNRVPVVVLRPWAGQDGIVVSINKGLQQEDWLRAKRFLESGQAFEAEVTGVNRGGVLVSFGRLDGFVPNSHLTSIRRGLRGERLRDAKSELIGRALWLVVLEVNQRRRLVLSEREAGRQRRQQVLEELTEGEMRTGVVANLVDFGAFVDLGGADGLIHISELDWKHVSHPKEVLGVGDEVEVYVLSVDREKERVGLSRKRLLPDPWYAVTENLHVGQAAEGTVTNVVDFGAFVDLGEGVEGLIHVSQMSGGDVVRAQLEPGSPITVRVLRIDHERRRIGLSLRDVASTVSPKAAVPVWQEGTQVG